MKKVSFFTSVFLALLLINGCSNASTNNSKQKNMDHEHHSNMSMENMDGMNMDGSDITKKTKKEKEISQQEVRNSLVKWYKKNITGKKIKIAILDTGIDKKNKDLTFVKGINFTSNNQNQFQDDNGHGTKIAGIIGARKNNYNLLGIAPESDLYIAKVADENGNVKFENLVKGIDWAIKQNVDIINISLEFPKGNTDLHQAIKKAFDKKIIIVSSSGNINYPGDTHISYPGAYKEVINVGMLNTKGKVYSKEFKDKKVDVFAPGEDIISSYFNNKMTLDTGVSFATAYTSGYIALLIQADRLNHKSYDYEQIKKQIQKNLQAEM